MQTLIRSALALSLSCAFALPATAQVPPMIDTHMHFQMAPVRNPEASRQSAVTFMDRFGISRSLLMPPPYPSTTQRNYYDIEDMQFVLEKSPGRFALLGGGALNALIHQTPADAVTDAVKAEFRRRADKIASLGAVGFGEIAILHVSIPAMGRDHAFESVPPDHPLLLLLADIAAEKDLPIDIHCDLVPEDMPLPEVLKDNPLNPPVLTANAAAFRRFLAHNPKAKIVWSHVGFEPLLTRHPQRVRFLLEQHPNLHMSFRLARGGPAAGAALTASGEVKPAWVALVSQFADRFMLGSDAFYESGGIARGSSEDALKNLRTLVESLPEPARSNVASGNAVRLYRLK